MVIMEKGYFGQYTGNARHSHTPVTKKNYRASVADDAAHIHYLKEDVNYDNKHGHSDENMTADEKHISKLAGDMKYDKKHHSPFNQMDERSGDKFGERLTEEEVAGFVSDFEPRPLTPGVTSDINATRSYDRNVANPAIERLNTANYTQDQIDAHNEIYKEAGLANTFYRKPGQRTRNPKYKK
mgnify:CR=1 FL=1